MWGTNDLIAVSGGQCGARPLSDRLSWPIVREKFNSSLKTGKAEISPVTRAFSTLARTPNFSVNNLQHKSDSGAAPKQLHCGRTPANG
ncbi:hypothetical protein EVAR_5863_1 [Eumeta japonica]|uniref:Uncharacterized protein n=1 Tax=Eumeta variegata TaxID=151549 RepID=A0A4C1TC26_EUMVA|nr:hypothetical protein EVAR_5863_1 [Eumeta japonica]